MGNKKGNLEKLSSNFYSYIPHDFGIRDLKLFTIDSFGHLKQKIDLIQDIIGINIGLNISESTKNAKNLLDEKYDALNCEIKTVYKY